MAKKHITAPTVCGVNGRPGSREARQPREAGLGVQAGEPPASLGCAAGTLEPA